MKLQNFSSKEGDGCAARGRISRTFCFKSQLKSQGTLKPRQWPFEEEKDWPWTVIQEGRSWVSWWHTHLPPQNIKVSLQMAIQPPGILLEGSPGWGMSTKGGEASWQKVMWWINSWENDSYDNKFDHLWERPGFCPEDPAHLNPRPGHWNIVESILGKEMGILDENDDDKSMVMIRSEICWLFTACQDFEIHYLTEP